MAALKAVEKFLVEACVGLQFDALEKFLSFNREIPQFLIGEVLTIYQPTRLLLVFWLDTHPPSRIVLPIFLFRPVTKWL